VKDRLGKNIMVKLQHLINRKQKKEAFTLVVPREIVRLLKIGKGQEFAVRFNQENKSIEYIPIIK
jgi:hypothetical protein